MSAETKTAAAMTQPAESTNKPSSQPEPKETNWGKILLIGCLVLLCCIVLCVVSGFLLLSASFGAVVGAVNNATVISGLCDVNTSELRDVYEEMTTEDFQEVTTFYQFQSYIEANKDVLGNCQGKLTNLDLMKLFEGTSVNLDVNANGTSTIEIQTTINGSIVEMRLVAETGEEYKLDYLYIN